jgi:hypothetical protein
LQPTGIFIATPGGTKGSFWAAGGGPAADSDGFIYASTGNGTFDFSIGGTDFGDSLLKLNTVQNGFNVYDYFTPFNQAMLDSMDLDLGSGGVVVLPTQSGAHPNELVGGGKQGTLYVVDRDAMGGYNSAADMVVQEFPAITPSIKTNPVYWNGNLYLAGQKDAVKMFSLNGGVLSGQPTSQTSLVFPDRGPSLSISANGSNNGILWVVVHGTPVLYAYDATNLANEYYDTTQALKLRDRILATSRYVTPTIVNGKVYVGGLHELDAYGLLPTLVISAGNNQSGVVGSPLSVPLQMQATDAYSRTGIPSVPVTCKDGGAAGIFSSPSGVTNSVGIFSTNYTLPAKAKTITITCTATAYISSVFTETSAIGPATVIKQVSGNQQSAPVNTQLPNPLVVVVVDAHSNPIQGALVTFSDAGKGGTFSSPSATTDALGHATTSYTTPGAASIVRISATTGSLKPASFTETVTAAN